MRLVLALRVRNAKNRIPLAKIERRGGLTEDQSKSSDLAYSKYEAMLRRPSTSPRAYRLITYRCQQALVRENYFKLKWKKFF